MSQNGCAQTARPPAAWIASIASDRRPGTRARSRGSRDQVGGEERVVAVDLLVAQALRVGGVREQRVGEVRAPRGARAANASSSSSKPSSRSRSAIARMRRTRSARKSSSVEEQRRVGVVDAVAEDVQVLVLAVDGGELDRGHEPRCPERGPRPAPRPRRRRCRGRSARAARRRHSRRVATTSAGASAPSECVECDWRSKVGAVCSTAMGGKPLDQPHQASKGGTR